MKTKLCEADVIRLLQKRYGETAGNGNAYAFIPHVRDAAGFSANRTIDAYCMGLWPSRGLMIEAFEIKCSRSDWLRELKDPGKADGFCQRADRFWLVVADKEIVRDGELPSTWGLLAVVNGKIIQQVEAPLLRVMDGPVQNRELPPGLDRSFLAALLRGATYVALTTPEDIEEAERRGAENATHHLRNEVERYKELSQKLGGLHREFERATGLSLRQFFGSGYHSRTAAEVGAAVRTVLDGDAQVDGIRSRLAGQVTALERLLQTARIAVEEMDGKEVTIPNEWGG